MRVRARDGPFGVSSTGKAPTRSSKIVFSDNGQERLMLIGTSCETKRKRTLSADNRCCHCGEVLLWPQRSTAFRPARLRWDDDHHARMRQLIAHAMVIERTCQLLGD
jgi:hypothetical protein